MGLIVSRFRRKKTTTEILERLETKIKSIERDGHYTEQKHKRIIGYVMAYAVGLYILFVILYYFMYIGKSPSWIYTLYYAWPLLVLSILVILLRASISWYYNWSLNKNRTKLNEMRNEKKKILEEVMNNETYKVAKEILDKYGNPELPSKALKPFVPSMNVPGNGPSTPQPKSTTPGQLRQRQLALQSTPVSSKSLTIMPLGKSPQNMFRPNLGSPIELPRPILSNHRSALDKVVDFLLKDGPNYRMALICKECCSHNGMAMIEEFEYVSYVCAFCLAPNPARKQRPAAPALRPLPAIAHAAKEDDSPEPTSGSDSDEENVNLSKTGSENGGDRTSSVVNEAPKSPVEKKED